MCSTHGSQKGVSEPRELKFQVGRFVSLLMGLLSAGVSTVASLQHPFMMF